MMTTRGTANLLTRATAVPAARFIATSLTLAILSSSNRAPTSILDRPGSACRHLPHRRPHRPARQSRSVDRIST